jgi:hypothetical protein|nr:hypothetical protein [Neorhizobium tomejilense]
MTEATSNVRWPGSPQEIVTELAKQGIELAGYASYAEIVKMPGTNDKQIRELSDRIFALNHELESQLDLADAPMFDSDGILVERIERFEAVQRSSGQTDAAKSLHEASTSLKEANAEIERLRNAADNIAPYLIYTVGEESPGHHPTMPSAVGAFLHAFDIETKEKRFARSHAKLKVGS